MTDIERCPRCEEPIRDHAERPGLVPRVVGHVRRTTYRTTYRVSWTMRRRQVGARDTVTVSEVVLCDECWGALLSWVNEPMQARAQIAAENRRYRKRVAEVEERRREAEIKHCLDQHDREHHPEETR